MLKMPTFFALLHNFASYLNANEILDGNGI